MNNIIQSISPKNIIRGENAWELGKEHISLISKKPLLLGRSNATANTRREIQFDLEKLGLVVSANELHHDCCDLDIESQQKFIATHKCDSVIAAGGGKVLDAGKYLAQELSIPCITIPLSAATCAGWTALSNIYSKDGAFIRDISLKNCPELLLFDYKFVRKAPPRMLASGMADALAKWYEASLSSRNTQEGLTQQAVQMARMLRDQIFIDGYEALINPYSEAWIRISEGCALTAGVIGGIGGSKCRTAAAHALHNGLTQFSSCTHSLHGELVGVGILIQLSLEEIVEGNRLASQARRQLTKFLQKLNLPTTLEGVGLDSLNKESVYQVCEFACRQNSDIHQLPFKVTTKDLYEAILSLESTRKKELLGKIYH